MLLTLKLIWNQCLNAITHTEFTINSQQIFTDNLWREWRNVDRE